MRRREAARWLARLQSRRDPEIERKFASWNSHPANAEAFQRVSHSYERAGLLRQSAIVSAPSARDEGRPRPARGPTWAVAAALALVAGVVLLVGRAGVPLGGTEAVMLATRVGEIRSFALADGSQVTLDTATSVEVDHGARRARLGRGRARFAIARSSAPFVIEAGGVVVTAPEGVVDVEREGPSSSVAVRSGSADVERSDRPSSTRIALTQGEGAAAPGGAGLEKKEVPAAPDWTRGMLEFDSTPLPVALALANRYSGQRIIAAQELGGLRVTGVFRAGDSAGLARALAEAFQLSLSRDDAGNLMLSRPPREKSRAEK